MAPPLRCYNIPVVYFGTLVLAILARGAGAGVVLGVHAIPYSDRVRYWKLCTVLEGCIWSSNEPGGGGGGGPEGK